MAKKDWTKDVLDFWLVETKPEQRFAKDEAFDKTITERFGPLYERLAKKDARTLAEKPKTAIAAIIVFDQFSRNMFRGSDKAFAQDPKALEIANRSISAGHEEKLSYDERYFLYMPFMHSEYLTDQDLAIELFHTLGDETGEKYARLHREVIAEFGRFPHRNGVLGRITTPEEQAWLEAGGGF